MSKENELTIEVYEKFGDKYLERNDNDIKDNLKARNDNDEHVFELKEYLRGLPKNAKIFEVGSASGRDAKIIQSLGYKNIVVSDVANRFLELLKKEGFSPLKFNLITDEFPEQYDYIYCWAVLVHFTKEEARLAIKKMFDATTERDRVALSVQCRDGYTDNWVDKGGKIGAKRYFSYWTEDELRQCMTEVGFRKIVIKSSSSIRSCWIQCYAEK